MLKSVFILLVISTCVYSRDTSTLLSRLFKKTTKNASPLILVLDRNSLRPLTYDRTISAQESSEEADDSLQYLLEHLVQKSHPKSYSTPHKHLKTKDRSYRPSQTNYNYNYAKKQDDRERSALRSPIYRSLLSLRNRLQCGARNECEDECSQNYKGAKENKCIIKCEVNFECEEPTTPKNCDTCAIDYEACDDSTNQCDDQGSTKGELEITEKPECTRC
ncbi:uncharacterized protein isoform X2 [Choristoneura fumiferana]|uniref:uncharacterized protein isoform X2 n=1 Tax=Choristoneura fumiferana TaxID=7141 RepID=UPI003D1559F0